jgi:hypothetical protein
VLNKRRLEFSKTPSLMERRYISASGGPGSASAADTAQSPKKVAIAPIQ